MTQPLYQQDQSYDCTRCGLLIPGYVLCKRVTRGNTSTQCADCNAMPSQSEGECRPWAGDIDLDTMQPIRNGKPYMVGKRSCGNADCVRRSHIVVDWQSLVAEQFSIEYRTSKRRDYSALLAVVEKERKGIHTCAVA